MLSKDNIFLQPTEANDYAFLVKWGNQKGLGLQARTKRKTNGREQKQYIEKAAVSNSRQTLTVFLDEGENLSRVGICEIYNIDYHHKTSFLNLYIEDKKKVLPIHGFKVLNLVLEYIFYRLGLYKVSTELLLEQNLEQTLFKQHDFEIEVRKRKHAFVGGKYKTVLEYSLMKPQFEK